MYTSTYSISWPACLPARLPAVLPARYQVQRRVSCIPVDAPTGRKGRKGRKSRVCACVSGLVCVCARQTRPTSTSPRTLIYTTDTSIRRRTCLIAREYSYFPCIHVVYLYVFSILACSPQLFLLCFPFHILYPSPPYPVPKRRDLCETRALQFVSRPQPVPPVHLSLENGDGCSNRRRAMGERRVAGRRAL
ncbi:hypothetical protein GGR52DRAFT_252878 [Hypoxylon sp. FL1284]|nr:hypothetical protein GGR52DRAFT_252878 [Hypoxylon sp. FL1284]